MDMMLFFMAPFMQIVGFVVISIVIIYNLLNVQINDLFQAAYVYRWVSVIVTYLLSIFVSSLVVILEDKKITKVYTSRSI
ncbi:hypothetical protein D3C73_1589930 [compost metagenome]